MSALDDIDRELLAEGLDDYVGLWEHVSVVRGRQPEASDEEVRAAVMERVARMLHGGYVSAGCLLDGGGFEPWDATASAAVERIAAEWSALGREPTIGDVVWFQNTAAGDELAGVGGGVSLLDAVGLRPDGDPAAMRAYATKLHGVADQVQRAGASAAGAVGAMTFVGPAGDATRRRAATMRQRNSAVVTGLRDLADRITREAGEVERGQHAWDQLRDRLERELREVLGGGP